MQILLKLIAQLYYSNVKLDLTSESEYINANRAKQIIYENIELIKPEKRAELMADLETRTGLKINRISIGKIDFLKDTALIKIYFFEE